MSILNHIVKKFCLIKSYSKRSSFVCVPSFISPQFRSIKDPLGADKEKHRQLRVLLLFLFGWKTKILSQEKRRLLSSLGTCCVGRSLFLFCLRAKTVEKLSKPSFKTKRRTTKRRK